MRYLLTAALVFLLACSKQNQSVQQHCDKAVLLSAKYTPDSVYIRTDTLWKEQQLCGKDLEAVMNTKDSWFCTAGLIEHWYYVVGNPLVAHK